MSTSRAIVKNKSKSGNISERKKINTLIRGYKLISYYYAKYILSGVSHK